MDKHDPFEQFINSDAYPMAGLPDPPAETPKQPVAPIAPKQADSVKAMESLAQRNNDAILRAYRKNGHSFDPNFDAEAAVYIKKMVFMLASEVPQLPGNVQNSTSRLFNFIVGYVYLMLYMIGEHHGDD